jgi:hypothetical protein
MISCTTTTAIRFLRVAATFIVHNRNPVSAIRNDRACPCVAEAEPVTHRTLTLNPFIAFSLFDITRFSGARGGGRGRGAGGRGRGAISRARRRRRRVGKPER